MKNLDKLLNHVSISNNFMILPTNSKLEIRQNSIQIEYIQYEFVHNYNSYLEPDIQKTVSYHDAYYYNLPKYIICLLQSSDLIKIELALNLI